MNGYAFVEELQAANSALLEKIGDTRLISTANPKADLVRPEAWNR